MNQSLSVVVINFQTPDLLNITIESFRKFYPETKLLIIDNGSKDNSRELIKDLQSQSTRFTTSLFLNENIFHGPAMHLAVQKLNDELLFFLDSDTKTFNGGFLEKMIDILKSSDKVYGVGRFLTINKRGFQSNKGITFPAPPYMIIKRNLYFKFSPFEHHGMPVLKNFSNALKDGYIFKEFPMENYIEHLWRGTAGKFGYGLGIKGKIDFVLNKFGL
ncbi:MAG TPA: glycosyltransferase family 2 protein [Ignavibacteriaceae bacterium]|nr:glycosyltransferase family 2 protein [Ignavibacteriaceae bacterium]